MSVSNKELQRRKLTAHPEWKTRYDNKACQRRLFLYLDTLSRRSERVAARMTHDIRRANVNILHKDEDRKSRVGFPLLKITASGKRKHVGKGAHYPPEQQPRSFKLSFIDTEKSTASKTSQMDDFISCQYGRACQSCPYFPCRRPQTYHSLGFRPDNCSTFEWITWSDLQKRQNL
ncbi:hypothetical protein Bpfe_027307 [Biomphalaria pfeifferi]|uniref:Uncharacterized protein n=1 Tax=Biomphalaria pfeifferi TaxID=112525 RepID=A0AAD8AWW3_BIOPF|nr:hypothetical protein Bpfe_027307 [Biomphalaria pfeifferi]